MTDEQFDFMNDEEFDAFWDAQMERAQATAVDESPMDDVQARRNAAEARRMFG